MQFLRVLLFAVVSALFSWSVSAKQASTKAEAAIIAAQQVKGQVLKVEQRGQRYKVKILQESGRVVSVMIDKKPLPNKPKN